MTIQNDEHEFFITGINDEIHLISLKSLDHFDGGFARRRKDGKVQNRHTPGSCLCYFVFVFGQKFCQLWTRLHHVFIYVAKTVNTSKSLVLRLCRISLDCVMAKQLKRDTNWCTRKQS